MTFQKSGRIAIAALAVVTALGVSACGSGEKETKHAKATTSAVVAAQGDYPPVPTAADLNAEFQRVVDPNVPNEEKLDMLQGVSADPDLPQRLTDFYKQNNASLTVNLVTDLGNGTLSADVQAALNGGEPQQAVVPFVAENGKWKVQKEWICGMLAAGSQTSPACS